MALYINKGNAGFQSSRRREYVDKSRLIAVINDTLDTDIRYSCVSRCRRFGKSMAAKMLCAYYDQSCDSRTLFADLQIASDPGFEEHLNKYPVVYLDMSDFVTRFRKDDIVRIMDGKLRADILRAYPGQTEADDDDLMDCLTRIALNEKLKFIFIIDEWDAILREFEGKKNVADEYVNWLRRMFKSGQTEQVFAGVYMTGILPIKKYNTESALNNFREYSMITPGKVSKFFGFTKSEVTLLSEKHSVDFEELEKWYDGYKIGDEPSVFNPNSVMEAVDNGMCMGYWGKTGAYDAVSNYISMNYDSLKDDILYLLSGGRVKVNTSKFGNDMTVVKDRDDVLTVLIHLGYLAFDWKKKECYVPNLEVSEVLSNAVEDTNWTHVAKALRNSVELLDATIDGDAEAVAQAIDTAHDEHTSILSYNNENSLACVISIAYYAARNDYIIHRELPSGKGFADMVFIPRKNVDKPAMVVELKKDHSAEAAINQIKRKNYPAKLEDYAGNILLVGINYDAETKTHTCRIEKDTP